MTLRLAHRGDWRVAPENTLGAFRAALGAPRCDGLEFDIRVSADGVPVVLHDDSLARVQGVDRLARDLSAAELEQHGVPALADVLALAGRDAFLDVELKELPGDDFLDVLAQARGEGDGLRRAIVSSFHPDVLAWVGSARPSWPRWGNAMDLSAATVAIAMELGLQGIAADWHGIDEPGVERATAAGLEVAAWTVRARSTFDR